MRDKEYREVQLSSSHLVFIFIGIIILGVVIFLLGVSVGKKQAQILESSEVVPSAKIEEVKGSSLQSEEKPKNSISKELALHKKLKEEPDNTPPNKQTSLYYIQVGAFTDKKAASTFAAKFKQKGYPAQVLSPFPADKKAIYRVRIGGYSSREKAEAIKGELARLKLKRRSDYFIVRK